MRDESVLKKLYLSFQYWPVDHQTKSCGLWKSDPKSERLLHMDSTLRTEFLTVICQVIDLLDHYAIFSSIVGSRNDAKH